MTTLIALKDYLTEQKTVSMYQLAHHFSTDAETLRLMLQCWVRKGRLTCETMTPQCGTACHRCDPLLTEQYRWM